MTRTHYFSPGPAALPDAVRARVASELLDSFGFGVSVMEISHRSKQYAAINDKAHELARSVLGVPDSHALFYTPFGAQQHFCLLLPHLTRPGERVAYTDTGVWAHIATTEAQNSGREVQVVYNGGPEYVSLGTPATWEVAADAKFLHVTVNNTVYGTEYARIPQGLGVDLILDMTSSLASRHDIPWNETALIYASAQKNFGIAGCSLVIVRKDALERMRETAKANRLGGALSYPAFFDAKSILNTPPCFSIYVAACYFEWIAQQGGVEEMERRALRKARLVYGEVDKGFYAGRANVDCRSRHNFVFRLPTPALDDAFIAEAATQGHLEIKGYRTTGGVRASMYNGVAVDSAEAFAVFMDEFRRRNG